MFRLAFIRGQDNIDPFVVCEQNFTNSFVTKPLSAIYRNAYCIVCEIMLINVIVIMSCFLCPLMKRASENCEQFHCFTYTVTLSKGADKSCTNQSKYHNAYILIGSPENHYPISRLFIAASW